MLSELFVKSIIETIFLVNAALISGSISSFLDIELRRYLALIEGNSSKKQRLRPGRDLNPSPKLDRLG